MEIIYAVHLGYQVLDYFEGYSYSKQTRLFETFMKVLAHFKLKVRRLLSNFVYKNYTCPRVLGVGRAPKIFLGGPRWFF